MPAALYDATAARFGDANVFMDVDLRPGIDFVERITQAVGGCDVLLVVIGPRWLDELRARSSDPADFVRLEVETALRRPDVTPIPLLAAGARMPEPDDLPAAVQPLARRNALELSDLRWRYDVGRLLDTIAELLDPSAAPPAVTGGRRQRRRTALVAALVGLLAAAAVAAAVVLPGDPDGDDDPGTTGGPEELTVAQPGDTPPRGHITVGDSGDQVRVAFEGTKGQRVVPDVRDVTFSATLAFVDPAGETILRPYGFEKDMLLRTERCQSPAGCGPVTIKRSGTHEAVIAGEGDRIGSLDLRLYYVDPDLRAETGIGAAPIRVRVAVGQSAAVAFRAPRARTDVVIRLDEIDLTEGYLTLRDPSGAATLKNESFSDAGAKQYPVTLGRPGTWVVHLRGNDLASGGLRIAIGRR